MRKDRGRPGQNVFGIGNQDVCKIGNCLRGVVQIRQCHLSPVGELLSYIESS